jgi:hypothetical protein
MRNITEPIWSIYMRRRKVSLYRHDLIDAAIKQHGLTNKKVARSIKCGDSTISRMRQPGYNPTLKSFLDVCRVLELEPSSVMKIAA